MALFKSLEIDTLKVRTLLIANPDNSYISKDFHIYSNGDGKTYWSTGVNASQFISLSTSVSTYENVTTNLIINTASTTKGEITSSIVGISSFAINLSTLSLTKDYVDNALGTFSTNLNVYDTSTYTTKVSTGLLISDIQSQLLSTQVEFRAQISTLSTIDNKQQSSIQALFLADSTIYRTLSSYTGSTFSGHQEIISNNYNSTQLSIISTSNYLSGYINAINTSLSSQISTVNTALSTNISTLNREISNSNSTFQQSISSIYYSSLKYTDMSIANIYSSTLTKIVDNNLFIFSSINAITSSINSTFIGTDTSNISQVSTALISINSTNVYLLDNLALLTSTGLTSNIYQTFIQLESYSAGIVESTVSTANNQIYSTISSFNRIVISSLNTLEASSINYIIDITESLVNNFNSSIASFNSSSIYAVSTIVGNGQSTQLALFSTTIQSLSSYSAFIFSTTNGVISTSYYSDYLTSPSIIMHRGSNLSTLSNVSTLTGLSSLTASITNLDLTAYKNFQILVSDISSEVYYGLTYNTNATVTNKDITVQIDMPSSYTNKFVTIDTGNLVKWLGRPKIFNQSAYGLAQKSSPKIFLSTFLGRQIIQMRMMSDALYVKDIYTYPYMYTTVSITGTINIVSNITPNNPSLAASTFIYKNTAVPLTWTTNDLNAKLGAKFIGTDENNRPTIATSGPYDASLLGANVTVPNKSVFSTYNIIELGVYSDQGLDQSSDSGNINTNSAVFAVANLPTPIYVFSPSINTKITISNPGNLNSYLQISELQIINELGENLMTTAFNKYANTIIRSSDVYQNDTIAWGPQNINDGSILSGFRGGINANIIDKNAFLSVEMSSFTNVLSPQTTLSSIVIYGSGAANQGFTLTNFILKIEHNIGSSLFYRTATLNGTTPFVLNL